MTEYKTLDGKVDSLAPYRNNPDDLVRINGKDIQLKSEDRKQLMVLDTEINSLEKNVPKFDFEINRTTGKYLAIAHLSAVLPSAFFGGVVLQGALDYSIAWAITYGVLTCLALDSVGFLASILKNNYTSRKNKQQELENKQQEKQQYLENLIK